MFRPAPALTQCRLNLPRNLVLYDSYKSAEADPEPVIDLISACFSCLQPSLAGLDRSCLGGYSSPPHSRLAAGADFPAASRASMFLWLCSSISDGSRPNSAHKQAQ